MSSTVVFLDDKILNKIISRHEKVQDRLTRVGTAVTRRAEANLAEAKAKARAMGYDTHGGAHVGMDRDATDRLVYLDDNSDLLAAMSIEYGRKAGKGPEPFRRGTNPTRILRDAAGIE